MSRHIKEKVAELLFSVTNRDAKTQLRKRTSPFVAATNKFDLKIRSKINRSKKFYDMVTFSLISSLKRSFP